jgi:arylformamidase
MTRLIDISPAITPLLGVWPGDVAFRRDVALDMTQGAHLTLSSMTTTLHLGAHADGPNHYVAGGRGIGEVSLEPYYGLCQVMHVKVGRGERIRPRHLHARIEAPRLLLRTGSFPDPNDFNNDFASCSEELIDHLAAHDVCLIGIDTPSVDLFPDQTLESHNAIGRHGMAILEGLVLDEVSDGLYTLVALPLKLMEADASPVRAALLPLS